MFRTELLHTDKYDRQMVQKACQRLADTGLGLDVGPTGKPAQW